MRRTAQFESEVRYGNMHWASPVRDTRDVRMATRTVNAEVQFLRAGISSAEKVYLSLES